MEMGFEAWGKTGPERVKAETCRRFEAYPGALHLYELASEDRADLRPNARGCVVAKQMIHFPYLPR